MARFLDIHPVDPQPRLIEQARALLAGGGLVVYPTDSGYALGCALDNKDGLERIRRIRRLDAKHHFTLVCHDFAQLGQFVELGNAEFRAIKASTPGPYTFILRATKEVPRRMQHPKKATVGVRIPDSRVALALVAAMGEPIVSSTLILPAERGVELDSAWSIKEALDHEVDAVIEAGEVPAGPTTVIDYTDGYPVVDRVGAGDPARFE